MPTAYRSRARYRQPAQLWPAFSRSAIEGSWTQCGVAGFHWCESTIAVARVVGTSVPRYYFHFSDGKRRFSDSAGHELAGMAAARQHAIEQVRDLKAAMCAPGVQDLSGWSMTVFDAGGKTVLELDFNLKVRTAAT